MRHGIRLTRRTLFAAALALSGLGLAALGLLRGDRSAQAADIKMAPETTAPAEPLTEMKIVERVTSATDRAMEYLASKQNADGSWHTGNNAPNALALLSFMGRGHVPGRGNYPDVLEKGKRFLLKNQRADGYTSFGTMYEHGLSTLALVEMYGNDPDPELEEKTRKAVDLILRCQGPIGGWNYGPSPADGDLSVSVMQIVAMRAAQNAGLPVSAAHINKAIAYLAARTNPAGPGFGYNSAAGGTPQTSAAGTLSMQLLGKFDDPQVAKTIEWLQAFRPTSDQWQAYGVGYFYYFHYYAIQAHYQAGGKYWNEWHPAVRELLLKHQNKDGSWDVPPGTSEAESVVGPNKVYWTAIAALVLDIYMHYLPAYQR